MQILEKKSDGVRSGHGAIKSQEEHLPPTFTEIVFCVMLLAAIDWNGDVMHDLGQKMAISER